MTIDSIVVSAVGVLLSMLVSLLVWHAQRLISAVDRVCGEVAEVKLRIVRMETRFEERTHE